MPCLTSPNLLQRRLFNAAYDRVNALDFVYITEVYCTVNIIRGVKSVWLCLDGVLLELGNTVVWACPKLLLLLLLVAVVKVQGWVLAGSNGGFEGFGR